MRTYILLAIPALLLPLAVFGQAHNAVLADHQPHYFDVADFGIDPASVTFADHIAPILQRSCETCHRPGGGGPMALQTYDQVLPWAPVIMYKTAIRDRMGAMPPFYVEKDIGIVGFKDDPSLSDLDLALIQAWVKQGSPRGNPGNEPAFEAFLDQCIRELLSEQGL